MRLTALENVSAVHKEVEGVLLWELYALADDESELVGGQIARSQIPMNRRSSISVNA